MANGTIPWLGVSLIVSLCAPPAAAEWIVKDREGKPPVATVRGNAGASLRILSSPESKVVFGTLTLPPGLSPLAADGCPSYQVDARKPGSFAEGGSCNVNGRSVSFVLGSAENDRVNSRAIGEMMNGRKMTVTYRYDRLGYGTSEFVLNGSLQALTRALNGWRLR